MFRSFVLCFIVMNLAGEVQAESLWKKVKKGAQSTGEAIGDGANAVGGAVGKGADAVGNSLSSTSELMSNEADPEETRARLDKMADAILTRLLAENPQAAELYPQSAGYAAFDARKVAVFPVSVGYGRGVAMEHTGSIRTYMNMGTGGLGAAFGIGGFESQFVILFETSADFHMFVTQGYDATAGAGTMAGEDQTDGSVRYVQGRSFFVLDKTGWRVNAGAEGTKYWKSPELN